MDLSPDSNRLIQTRPSARVFWKQIKIIMNLYFKYNLDFDTEQV